MASKFGIKSTFRMYSLKLLEISETDLLFLHNGDTVYVATNTVSSPVILAMYQTVKSLGKGGFGEVRQVRHKVTHQEAALKLIGMPKVEKADMAELILREAHSISQLNHPNIIRLDAAFQYHTNIVLILELARGGDLSQYL